MHEQLEKCVSMWRTHLQMQEKEVEQIRGLKHDMEAHFVVLRYYLEVEKYDDARAYLQELANYQNYKTKACRVELGNTLLNALVSGYMEQGENEIQVLCTGRIPKRLDINDYEVCVLFSNVISNAMEACRKLEKNKKEIHINISSDEDCVIVYIENPKEWFVDEEKLGTYSTKENSNEHGYGIKNIKRIVASLGGDLEFHVSEVRFGVKIILPL